MSSHLVFNGVDDVVKERLESYWAKKLPRLEKLLAPYPADVREIRLTVSHHDTTLSTSSTRRGASSSSRPGRSRPRRPTTIPRPSWTGSQTSSSRRSGGTRTRPARTTSTNARTATGPTSARPGPNCKQHEEAGNRDDFFRMLRPHLGFLRDYARREIRMLEQDGTLHRGELTVNDLLDQVMILAYERFKDRPRKVSLDLWLTDLVEDALEQWIKQEPRPHASLEDRADEVPAGRGAAGGRGPWWAELMDEEETLGLEDLIPDPKGTEPWTNLEAEEQRDRLLALIAKLPPERRQAFLLHALEGYATDEIAMLQDRPESEVKADIAGGPGVAEESAPGRGARRRGRR